MMSAAQAKNMEQEIDILGSQSRIRIIDLLCQCQRDMCVNEIAASIGVSQSATSHQLGKLEDVGIVRSFRMGQKICYVLTDSPITRRLIRVIETLR